MKTYKINQELLLKILYKRLKIQRVIYKRSHSEIRLTNKNELIGTINSIRAVKKNEDLSEFEIFDMLSHSLL